MSEAAEKLLEEAMKLPPEERSRLARLLLASTGVANDDMGSEDLAALEEALGESERQFSAGEGREFFSAVADLRTRS